MGLQFLIEVKAPASALASGRGLQVASDEMRAAAEESLAMLRDEIVQGTPVGVSGALRAGTQTSLAGDAVDLTGRVFNPLSYAPAVEYGRKPGSFPPLGPIELWVRRKLGVHDDEARSVAFLVARKIATQGTKGAHMFRNAIKAKRGAVNARFRLALSNIKARLAS